MPSNQEASYCADCGLRAQLGITSRFAQCRAFLARRRGHGGAVKRESFIRAGGLKTCWTKPQGTAVPQLWALQLGEKLQCPEKTGREGRGQELRAIAVPRR